MKELNQTELEQTNGGFFQLILPVLGGAAVLAAGAILADWSDFKDGIKEGWAYTKNQ